VWSDVVCPWCYIGKRRLEQALETFPHRDGVTVTYRSFQLDPTTPKDVTGTLAERLADKYGVSLDQARAMNERVSTIAASVGLDYHLDEAHPANTFDAHRLLHFAAEHGKQTELKERLMQAYFVRGEAIADAEALVAMAAEVGLDAGEARAVLAGDAYSDAVREDLSLARAFGISSVPFFVIDRKYGIAGAQETAVLGQALENAWMESHPLTMVSAAPAGGADAEVDSGAGECADGVCRVPD
jgi:predicted DsbA family dithiol-disulfide isomerase